MADVTKTTCLDDYNPAGPVRTFMAKVQFVNVGPMPPMELPMPEYFDHETISVILTVAIRYKHGSPESRADAIRLATEHHLDAGGVGLGGCYGAKSVKAQTQPAMPESSLWKPTISPWPDNPEGKLGFYLLREHPASVVVMREDQDEAQEMPKHIWLDWVASTKAECAVCQ